jgi:ribosomal protein S18 acetylase RimI-like enzyme
MPTRCCASPDLVEIRSYQVSDESAVIRLWTECDLVRPWNDPRKDIQRKLTVQPDLFLVGVLGSELVATVMAGYDGHRGWVNYLAVAQQHRRRAFGTILMQHVEARLKAMGCPKLNMQVRATNRAVLAFYERLGYAEEPNISLGKRIISDV